MAVVGNNTTPTHNWFEQGVNTPPNQVYTSYTMPSGGGTITQLFGYFVLVAGSGSTAFVCVWNASGSTILCFWSGAVPTGSTGAGNQQWNGGNVNSPTFIAGGTVIVIGFSVQQANGFIASDESSGSSSWNTVAAGSAPGPLTGGSSSGFNAVGAYANYTPGEGWVWNGSAWVNGPIVVWNGSAWANPTGIQVWNGSAWVNAT